MNKFELDVIKFIIETEEYDLSIGMKYDEDINCSRPINGEQLNLSLKYYKQLKSKFKSNFNEGKFNEKYFHEILKEYNKYDLKYLYEIVEHFNDLNDINTLYMNLNLRSRKIQTYSKRYGFKKFDYIKDCIKFLEDNPLGVDFVRFDLGHYGAPIAHYCDDVGLKYDKMLKINTEDDYEFQEICKSLDNNTYIKHVGDKKLKIDF